MTDVEKFEYKSEKKPIKVGSNYFGISKNNGLKCDWRCVKMSSTAIDEMFMFSWKFNWDELKKRGIDRLSGYIIVQLYNSPIIYEIMEDLKINVDLKKSNQIIKKVIETSMLSRDHHAIYEYSLTPHYRQIEEVKKESSSVQNDTISIIKEKPVNEKVLCESLFEEMFTPSEQNDAILVVDGKKIHINKTFLSCHSKYFRILFSSNHQEGQMNEIPIEGVSYKDFKLLLGTISPNTVFPTDEAVEKLLELADRFMMPSVIRHVEHHLLHMSKLGNEKKMLMGETYGMPDLLEKMILEIDTIEKAKKWKQSSEYNQFSYKTKNRVLVRFI